MGLRGVEEATPSRSRGGRGGGGQKSARSPAADGTHPPGARERAKGKDGGRRGEGGGGRPRPALRGEGEAPQVEGPERGVVRGRLNERVGALVRRRTRRALRDRGERHELRGAGHGPRGPVRRAGGGPVGRGCPRVEPRRRGMQGGLFQVPERSPEHRQAGEGEPSSLRGAR